MPLPDPPATCLLYTSLQEEIDRIRSEQAWQGATELPPITLPPAEGEEEGVGEE